MKIWLLEKGEKSEPQESFEVRERISSGELKAETLAWYKGADAWMRLDEVPQFRLLFEEEDLTLPPPLPDISESLKEAIEKEAKKAPPIHLFRRLFARFHDSILYISLVIVLFREHALDALQGDSMLQFLPIGIAYVILDGLMTHVWQSSPGKFLLGMRVTDQVGHAIPLKGAMIRSLRVWIVGLGMWMLWPIAMLISWLLSLKFGYFLWDIPYRYRVVAKPFSALHVLAFVASIFVMSALLNIALPQELIDTMNERSGAQEILDQWGKEREPTK